MPTYLQVKRILEEGFVPYACRCTLEADGSLSVQLLAPGTGAVELSVPQIPRAHWSGLRALAGLVLELRQSLGMTLACKGEPVLLAG